MKEIVDIRDIRDTGEDGNLTQYLIKNHAEPFTDKVLKLTPAQNSKLYREAIEMDKCDLDFIAYQRYGLFTLEVDFQCTP